MSQHVSPEFRPSKAPDAIKRLQSLKEQAADVNERMIELNERAKEIVKKGDWQEQGEVFTYEEGVIGSRRRWLETFNGTQFARLGGSDCRVALREVSAEDGTHNVRINLFVKESSSPDEQPEVLAIFASAQVHIPGVSTVTPDVLSSVQDILVELESQQSNGS